jgi:N-acetylglucosaminyldiphosphoundecaprenol N-acetyl-beta-D-mannosaminyltransferase
MASSGVVLESYLFRGTSEEALAIWQGWRGSFPAKYVCFANVHMSIEAFNDERFYKVVTEANTVCADGQPLVWASQLLLKKKTHRLSGMDMLPQMLQHAEENGIRCFFIGGSESAEKLTVEQLKVRWPKLVFDTYSPPFGEWNQEEWEKQFARINKFDAQWTFVVLGCPKQELWMSKACNNVHGVLFGVGGALPVLLGLQKRAPQWMQRIALEWLFRLIQEPKRMWRRYLKTNFQYVNLFFIRLLTGKISNRIKFRS